MKNKDHKFEQETSKTLEAYEAPEINCLNGEETETGAYPVAIESGTLYRS
ncbi:MAG: hypothetical protein PHV59_02335 [Victivallales bacterium]|nr:hypothetical protein [Victivallales bacterium]